MIKTRHLTVMFTDIKDFTLKTSAQTRDQHLRLLELHDTIIRPIFEKFEGNIIKTIGDAFLVTFESPTNAVLCGMAVQKALQIHNDKAADDEKIEIRVAINTGEVAIRDNDVFGEAVNIASRIEKFAEVNEVYFTEAVYLSMNKQEIPSAEIGFRHLKGIPNEIKIYKVLQEVKSTTDTGSLPAGRKNSKERSGRRSRIILGLVTGFLVILAISGGAYLSLYMGRSDGSLEAPRAQTPSLPGGNIASPPPAGVIPGPALVNAVDTKDTGEKPAARDSVEVEPEATTQPEKGMGFE